MRVVAYSHAIYWYLISPEQLSDVALDALGEAEDTEHIAVSALTMPELWMAATRKRGAQALPRIGYEIVRAALLDPATALDVAPPDAWYNTQPAPETKRFTRQ